MINVIHYNSDCIRFAAQLAISPLRAPNPLLQTSRYEFRDCSQRTAYNAYISHKLTRTRANPSLTHPHNLTHPLIHSIFKACKKTKRTPRVCAHLQHDWPPEKSHSSRSIRFDQENRPILLPPERIAGVIA